VVQISRDPVTMKRGRHGNLFQQMVGVMKRYEKIALIVAGHSLPLLALFFAWSTNYAAASFFLLKSTTMWKSFTTDDLTMPAKQAWVYLGNPKVRSLIGIAALATLVEAAIATGGVLLLIFRPWEVRPPGDGSRFATLKDLEKSGADPGRARKIHSARHLWQWEKSGRHPL
jgi:type IV secretion system protein VirD4